MCKNKKTNRYVKHESRRLFVVDIENYCGKPVLSEADVRIAKQSLIKNFHPNNNDLIVVGTSHTSNFINVGMVWTGIRQVIGKGHDGADFALLKALKDYQVETFSEIYIFSGDGIFTEAVDEMALKGIVVAVVSKRRCLSSKLAKHAPNLCFINPTSLEVA